VCVGVARWRAKTSRDGWGALPGLIAVVTLMLASPVIPVPSASAQTGKASQILPDTLLPSGNFSTRGGQIVDQRGRPVRLACVGWNQVNEGIGLETQTRLMAAHGFNCIRFSWTNGGMQRDLALIDRVAAAAGKAGLRLIIDNHTNEPWHGDRDNWGAQQKNGLWYDSGGASDGTDGGGNPGTTTDAKFLSDWQAVAKRYSGSPTVIGYDLRNEPLNYPGMSLWGGGSNRDIRAMYMRVGNAIQAVDAAKLIIVEPPSGDLRVLHHDLVALDVSNKVVYSPHEYPAEISAQKPDAGPGLVDRLNKSWGWVVSSNIAPVLVGEIGSSMASAESKRWADTMVPYLNGTAPDGLRLPPGGQGVSTVWWAWGHLGDQMPNGTLESDWKTARPGQLAIYSKLRQRPLSDQ